MALVTLQTVFDPVEAEIMRMRLEAGGIEAVLFDAGIASLIGSGLSGVRLMVLGEDEAEARALLAAGDLTGDMAGDVAGDSGGNPA